MKTKKLMACLDALIEQVGPDRAKWNAVHAENLRLYESIDRQRGRIRELEKQLSSACAAPGSASGNRCNGMQAVLSMPHKEGEPFVDRVHGQITIGVAGFAGAGWVIQFCPWCGKKLEF